MAARLSPKHDEMTRSKIRTSQLVNRLQAFVFGEPDGTSGKPVQMTRDQLTAVTDVQRADAAAGVERIARQNRRASAVDIDQWPGKRDADIAPQSQRLYAKRTDAGAVA